MLSYYRMDWQHDTSRIHRVDCFLLVALPGTRVKLECTHNREVRLLVNAGGAHLEKLTKLLNADPIEECGADNGGP